MDIHITLLSGGDWWDKNFCRKPEWEEEAASCRYRKCGTYAHFVVQSFNNISLLKHPHYLNLEVAINPKVVIPKGVQPTAGPLQTGNQRGTDSQPDCKSGVIAVDEGCISWVLGREETRHRVPTTEESSHRPIVHILDANCHDNTVYCPRGAHGHPGGVINDRSKEVVQPCTWR